MHMSGWIKGKMCREQRRIHYGIIRALVCACLTLTLLFGEIGVHRAVDCEAASLSFVLLSRYTANVKIGDSFYLIAINSSGRVASFRSSNSKVASVDSYGRVTAKASGSAYITAKIKGAEAKCKVTVEKTTIRFTRNSIRMYRGNMYKIGVSVSTGHRPTYRSSNSKVAKVNADGVVTAVKNGTAKITVSVDGVSKKFSVTVNKPTITLNVTSISLSKGTTLPVYATVSSGNIPTYSTSNKKVATISATGVVRGVGKGTCYVYASEDGTKVKCKVVVK